MKKILSIFLFLLSFCAYSQIDKNISNTIARETEPYIAINPLNPNNIIAAWMTINYPLRIVTITSFDGGISWGNTNYLPHFTTSILATSADVSITFNKSGTAFICYVDYKLTLDSGFVRIAKSTNGGVSWHTPVNAVSTLTQPDKPIDRPWLVCDQSNSSYSGRLYLVSKSYWASTTPHKIWLSISTDTAKTFSPILRLDNPVSVGSLTNIMGVPTVGADGTFYCAYASWVLAHDPYPRFVCTKSVDGGNTFTQYTIVYPVTGSSVNDTLYQGSFSLTANPIIPRNLIFQAIDGRYGDPDVLCVYSVNSGQNWSSTPVRVNDDAINNGIGQDMSWGAFTPNGIYALTWRDRRHGIPNDTSSFEIYTAVSTDGGINFKQNYCLSSAISPYINVIRGNDFLGVALNNTDIYACWSDNRNKNPNKEDIYLRKENLGAIGSIKNPAFQQYILTIYPNPSDGTVHLIAGDQKIKVVNLFTTDGKLIKQFYNDGFSVSDLSPGIYYIQVETDKSTFVHQLIKQ